MKIKPVHVIAAIAGLWILAWAFFEVFQPGGTKTGTTDSAAQVDQLKIEDVKVGTGPEATEGKTVEVHYTGTLINGNKFDSSRDKGKPLSFKLGAGTVIPGWDQGVKGMKVGGRRKLTVPPSLGYGSRAMGDDIPPNSTLLFDIELLAVK